MYYKTPLDDVLQWCMVMIVLGAAVYLAVMNNTQEIIFNLATLCFGYYFGQRNTPTPPAIK